MIQKNDSMTDEFDAEINCHTVTNRTLKIKYKAYRQSLKKKPKTLVQQVIPKCLRFWKLALPGAKEGGKYGSRRKI